MEWTSNSNRGMGFFECTLPFVEHSLKGEGGRAEKGDGTFLLAAVVFYGHDFFFLMKEHTKLDSESTYGLNWCTLFYHLFLALVNHL